MALVMLAKQRVRDTVGIELELEMQVVGVDG